MDEPSESFSVDSFSCVPVDLVDSFSCAGSGFGAFEFHIGEGYAVDEQDEVKADGHCGTFGCDFFSYLVDVVLVIEGVI